MNTNTAKPRYVNCPTCGKPVAWAAENRYRPFCSKRCKMIDLGAWAAEDYRVPVQEEQPLDTSEPDERA
ncbi:MAG: DNA gyrase inhibitor YacG [Betaproteobacteria bacterium]|nr:DNA gyrase inhibitor YacG [Betaproteobacteria bacterium]